MQGTIAQIVALTAHGNAILQKRSAAEGSLQTKNSTFRFCEWVKFTDAPSVASTHKELAYAPDVKGWFERLHSEGVCAIRMSYGSSQGNSMGVPDRALVGFVGGGGKWRIQTCHRDGTDAWDPHWHVGDKDRADKKIWRVSYARVSQSNETGWNQGEDLAHLKNELRQVLLDIAQLSREQQLDSFTGCFESAITRLDSETPLNGLFHDDLAPANFLALDAYQLLGSAEAAWVFGGMGSWNDVYFQKMQKARYDDLSERLYRLLNRAIVAAANSHAASP